MQALTLAVHRKLSQIRQLIVRDHDFVHMLPRSISAISHSLCRCAARCCIISRLASSSVTCTAATCRYRSATMLGEIPCAQGLLSSALGVSSAAGVSFSRSGPRPVPPGSSVRHSVGEEEQELFRYSLDDDDADGGSTKHNPSLGIPRAVVVPVAPRSRAS